MRLAIVLSALAVAALGCTPSPDKVCEHAMQISASGKPIPEKAKASCVELLTKRKESDPDLYACSAKCSMDATTPAGLKDCDRECEKSTAKAVNADEIASRIEKAGCTVAKRDGKDSATTFQVECSGSPALVMFMPAANEEWEKKNVEFLKKDSMIKEAWSGKGHTIGLGCASANAAECSGAISTLQQALRR